MWPIASPPLVATIIGGMLALTLIGVRFVQPEWWGSRPARALISFAFAGMTFGLALWTIGRAVGSLRMVHTGAGLAQGGILVFLPATIVVPIATLLDRVLMRAIARRALPEEVAPASAMTPEWRRKLSAARVKVSRRALIRFGSASLPAMAAIGGASGFLQAKRDPTMPVIRLRWPGLHPDLHGLRILHLSDLHLGACLGLDDLARGLEIARAAHRPDLIVLTGDLADDASLIPEALRMIAEANARYGALASLGNHEYLHDIAVTRPLYEKSPVPLLCGSGRSLRIGKATLFAGGADDPVHMGGDIPWFLEPSIQAAAAAAPRDADFRLLLCHRPEGLGPAAAHGFDLTLSGHTHGGQIGLFGRSLLERMRPGVGWWGTYAKARPRAIARDRELGRTRGPLGPTRLYTTSGFGHWFPFRMGCPTEMPIVVLEGEDRSGGPARKV